MARLLALASIVWVILLGVALRARMNDAPAHAPNVVYLAASHICHQRPARSFHTAGVPWPVCARCSGLYLAAPFGALAALLVAGRRGPDLHAIRWLAIAAAPTLLTLAVEWTGLSALSNAIRAVSALPLGAMLGYVLVRTAAADAPRAIG